MKDYYKILGTNHDADIDQIKEAYHKLFQKFHPDVNNQDEYFINMFTEVQEAYETLIDTDKRLAYNFKYHEFYNSRTEPKEQQTSQSVSKNRTKVKIQYLTGLAILSVVTATLIYFFGISSNRVVNWDKIQKRNEIYYLPNEQNPFTGTAITKYKNGQIEYKRSIKDGKFNGEVVQYYENGQIVETWNIRDNVVSDGEHIVYDQNGLIIAKKIYKDGEVFEGVSVNISNGKIFSKSVYKNGKKNGEEIFYTENGQISSKTNYIDGKKNGEDLYYGGSNQILYKSIYVDDKEVGETVYYKNGIPYYIE